MEGILQAQPAYPDCANRAWFFFKQARIAKIKKTMKQIFAIQAAVPAITPNPRTAAMIATIKKPESSGA